MRFCFFLILLLVNIKAPAQIEYLDTTGIENLKKTTTIFVLPDDTSEIAAFKQVIALTWKMTPYLIVSAEDLPKYVDKAGYSFFCELCSGRIDIGSSGGISPNIGVKPSVGGILASVAVAGIIGMAEGSVEQKQLNNIYYRCSKADSAFSAPGGHFAAYELFIPELDTTDDKKEMKKKLLNGSRHVLNNYFAEGKNLRHYAVINLGLANSKKVLIGNITRNNEKRLKKGQTDTFSINTLRFTFWNPGIFMSYLNEIQIQLTSPTHPEPFSNYRDNYSMRQLHTDTLYIPYDLGRIIADEPQDSLSPAQIDSAIAEIYSYPYRCLENDELTKMIMDNQKPINFITCMAYINNNGNYHQRRWKPETPHFHCVQIYNSRNGNIYTNNPKHVKHTNPKLCNARDLEDVATAIAK